MENATDGGTTVRGRNHAFENRDTDGTWAAQDSLRRHVDPEYSADEQSPLLGNGEGSPDENPRESEIHVWEGQGDYEGLPWWRTPSICWLLPGFFFLTLAIGGIIVPKLNLILSLVCREYLAERSAVDPTFIFAPVLLDADNPQCRIPEVQALTTKFYLYMTITTGILSAIVSPRIGALSDRFGRVKFLMVASLGGVLTEVITILAVVYPDTISYQWLLLGATFDGICGSFTGAMAVSNAYAADCTPPPRRAVAFGYIHACLFAGMALGPLVAAAILSMTHQLISIFYCALGVHTAFILFIIFVLPESLTPKRQLVARGKWAATKEHLLLTGQADSWYSLMKGFNLLAPLAILFPTGQGTSASLRLNLILLSAVDTIIFGVAMGSMAVIVLYSEYFFGWSTSTTSIFVSVVSTSRVFGLIVLLPVVNYLIRTRRANKQRRLSGFVTPEKNSGSDWLDLLTIRAAILFEILGYGGYTLARTGPLFVLSGICAALGGIGSPTLQSALTRHVPHDRVGQLLGAGGLLHALARVVCPAVFGLIYAETVGSYPQAVFIVLTASFGVAFLASWGIRANVYLDDPNPPSSIYESDSRADSELLEEEITGF